MEPHRRRELLKIRQSFLERYKLAKQFKDSFYTRYFAKQIREIDGELERVKRELEENNLEYEVKDVRKRVLRIEKKDQ